MQLIIGIVAGGMVSWFITHLYYQKSSKKVPAWAEGIIDRLPEVPPTKEKLLELFQESLTDGDVEIHSVFGIVACPECKAPIRELKESVFGNDGVTIVTISCPYCGWNKSSEI